MPDIITRHDPWSYTDQQTAEMLLIHATLNRGTLTVMAEPVDECGEGCRYCARTRELGN